MENHHFYRCYVYHSQMGASINGGTQKWLVYNGKSQSTMDDLVVPLFQETSTSPCAAQISARRFNPCQPTIPSYPKYLAIQQKFRGHPWTPGHHFGRQTHLFGPGMDVTSGNSIWCKHIHGL